MQKVFVALTPALFSLALAAQQTPSSTPATAGTAHASAPMAAPTAEPPAHPITDAQVRELEQLNGSDKLKDQLTEYILRNFRQAPFMPKDVIDDLSASLAKVDVETPMSATYKKYLSTEDATKIIEFYRSPAGRDFLKTEPQINTEVQRTAMQAGQQAARAVVDKHRAEIEAAQKAWQQQHAGPALGGVPPKPGSSPTAPAGSGSSTAPKPQQ